jgi:Fungal specific transcription factor domain
MVDPEASFESHRLDESFSDDTNQMHRQTIDAVVEATRLCFKIYSDRLRGKTASNAPTLEYLKTLVFDIQPGSTGGHSLVWQYFIAAADSDIQEQRAFFTDRLIDIYNTTGCANISEGLKMLEQLWAQPPNQMWPQILPMISTTFVM